MNVLWELTPVKLENLIALTTMVLIRVVVNKGIILKLTAPV